MYIYIYVYTKMHIYIYMYIYMFIYIYIYIHIYKHVYVCIYASTCTCVVHICVYTLIYIQRLPMALSLLTPPGSSFSSFSVATSTLFRRRYVGRAALRKSVVSRGVRAWGEGGEGRGRQRGKEG